MKKIIHLASSVKGNASSSIRLANTILEKLTVAYPTTLGFIGMTDLTTFA